MSNARSLALAALTQARLRHQFIDEALEAAAALHPVSPQDRRLACQIAFGVTRRRATLNAVIAPFLSRPLEKLETPLVDVLHLGVYQILFLESIPPHAAVYETVELATAIGRPAAKGLVNSVLRRVCEILTDEGVDAPDRSAVPLETPTPRYRRLKRPLFASPGTPDYLAAAFSWPHWLAERWLKRDGLATCINRGFWFNAPPPLWIRVNTRLTRRETYCRQLYARGIEAEPGEHPQSLRLGPQAITDLPGFAEGLFCVQDHTSMLVASALTPQPGQRILDLCAAPGGKATHLAELMNDQGCVLACDVDQSRLRTLTTLAQRLGLQSIETRLLARCEPPPPGPFDAALVDAPCSNTGVLGRRPEVRWRLKPRDFKHLQALQTQLLLAAAERVKPGGIIVYATCSIEAEENSLLLQTITEENRWLALECEHHAQVGQPSDGGYWARIRKVN